MNSNIAALKESAEAQMRLNPKGALMLDPQFALFCVEEHNKKLVATAETFIEAGRRAADVSKCSDGYAHRLYAIHTDGHVEEVGCERCTFKIVGSTANPEVGK